MPQTNPEIKSREELAEFIIDRHTKGLANRSTLTSTWDEAAELCIPRRATFLETLNKGASSDGHQITRHRSILDSTAPRSLELFASFLQNLVANPAVQWFELAPGDDVTLRPGAPGGKFLENAQKRMAAEFLRPIVNLYNHLHNVYLDEGVFGNAILDANPAKGGDGVRFRWYHLQDVIIDENHEGMVDTVVRREDLFPRQARQRWPGQELGSAVDGKTIKDDQSVPFINAAIPMTDLVRAAKIIPELNDSKPFANVWVNKTDRTIVSAGVSEEFPYFTPRWYRERHSPWGRSPAMTVLPDIRMANRVKETLLRGAEKAVDPPMLLPDGALVSPLRLYSGGTSFVDGNVTPQFLVAPGAGQRLSIGESILASAQKDIRDGFFVPLFITPDSPVKTATEVLQQKDERDKAVSPMINRLIAELFNPLIQRTFNILARQGAFGNVPPELIEGGPLKVEFRSPLMAAQRQGDALATLRLLDQLVPIAQVPGGEAIFDDYDFSQISIVLQEGTGAPQRIRKSKAKVKQDQAARAQQANQVQAAELAAGAADASAKLTTANAAQLRAQKA